MVQGNGKGTTHFGGTGPYFDHPIIIGLQSWADYKRIWLRLLL